VKKKETVEKTILDERLAFSFTEENGDSITDFNSNSLSLTVRDNFTHLFYPNRFRLRKLLFEQDLESLSLLVQHALLRYLTQSANVFYVEFSVGHCQCNRCNPIARVFLLQTM
jgi:hypothetical protein